jgi:hypothetical protein
LELENEKKKPMILVKGIFTLGKVKTTKFVKEQTCDCEICEIFSNKFRKNIEIMFKPLEKAVLLENTAVFTLAIQGSRIYFNQ